MIKPRLFTPGPTDVPPEVLLEMARPMLHHRTAQFRQIVERVNDGLKRLLMTENDVLTIAGSGTAGMEAAIACAVPRDKKVLVADGGKFGERWVKVARRFGLDVDEVKLPWGTGLDAGLVAERLAKGGYGAVVVVYSETSTATACDLEAIGEAVADTEAILIADCITAAGCLPLRTDEWHVDIVGAGSQKAFMLPPGLAILSVSPKAWNRVEAIGSPAFYLDLKAYRKNLPNDTPYTAPVSLIRGLEVSLKMIHEIGIETIWRRTALLAAAVRAAARAWGLEVFSKQPSDSVTAIILPGEIADKKLRPTLQGRFGCSIAGGQDDLKGKAVRISHMGYVDMVDTVGLVAAMELALAECGVAVEAGAGVAAAMDVLRDWR